MNAIQQPNRAPIDAWALPHSRGKASQRPAFTPVQPSPLGLIRHPTAILAQHNRYSHHWQGDIDNGPFDCNVSLQPIVELCE